MRKEMIALAALIALCLGTVSATVATAVGITPKGSIAMQIYCIPKANSVQVFNDTDEELDLRTWTVASLYQPGPDEPIVLNGTIAPGGAATFFSGASKTRVLIGHDIFQPGQPSEGARLTTPYGTLDVLCSAGRGTLALGTLPGLPNTGGGAARTPRLSVRAVLLVIALLVVIGGWRVKIRHRDGRIA